MMTACFSSGASTCRSRTFSNRCSKAWRSWCARDVPGQNAAVRVSKPASRSDFDSLYTEMQVQAHEQAVDLFSSYAEQDDREPLREFAATTLPVLEEHLEQARELQQQIAQ